MTPYEAFIGVLALLLGASLVAWESEIRGLERDLADRTKTNEFFRQNILWQQERIDDQNKTIRILRSEFMNADGTPLETISK